jgi:hypothetical protein
VSLPLSWYLARARRTSGTELPRRLGRAARIRWDLQRRRATGSALAAAWYDGTKPGAFFFAADGHGSREDALRPFGDTIAEYADAARAGRPRLFGRSVASTHAVPDWHRDYSTGRRAPLRAWAKIQHRSPDVVGNIKYIWELNRHAHLVDLARYVWLTGDAAAADALERQLADWIAANPYLLGVNWGHGLEHAIRLMSWSWVAHLAPPRTPAVRAAFAQSIAQQTHVLQRYLSFGSSANNHLIGEAAGLFVASLAFRNLRRARAYQAQARAILEREILRQSFPDGGIRELASGYLLFDVECFQLCDLLATRAGHPFSFRYRQRLTRMERTLADLRYRADAAWMLKDGDDGQVLPARATDQLTAILNAATLRDAGQPRYTEAWDDRSAWLWGGAGYRRWLAAPAYRAASAYWPDTGWLCRRNPLPGGGEAVWFCDAGGPGLGPLYAHNHSDCLQVLLAVDGVPVLVDPGTFSYRAEDAWRDYFRSSAAHNVCAWDGADHGRTRGCFMWDRVAAVSHKPAGDAWEGSVRRADGSTWHRTVRWDGPGHVTIDDTVDGPRTVTAAWQFGPDVEVALREAHVDARVGRHRLRFRLPTGFQWSLLRGSVDPIGGWYSPAFDRKVPSTALIGTGPAGADVRTTIALV